MILHIYDGKSTCFLKSDNYPDTETKNTHQKPQCINQTYQLFKQGCWVLKTTVPTRNYFDSVFRLILECCDELSTTNVPVRTNKDPLKAALDGVFQRQDRVCYVIKGAV